jgi:phosphate transport system protein
MHPHEHIDREYEHELHRLREQLLVMGGQVEAIIGNSIEALVRCDAELATRTMSADQNVDRMEVELDSLCLQILARRQPVASDLRFITLVLKVVTDLERIADLGVNVCERVVELGAEPQLKPYVDIPRMGREVQAMLRDVLDAFVAKDAARARAIIVRDETVDALYNQVFRELLTLMMEDAHNVYRATRLQSVAKYLERMADHTTNLAEMVIFMIDGQDVRHQASREEPKQGSPSNGGATGTH